MKLKAYIKPQIIDYSVDSQILLIAQSPPIGDEEWGTEGWGDGGGNKSTSAFQQQENSSPFRNRITGNSPFE
ncbi:MAG: hypothetical protein J6Y82_08170 [Bacteroidales bacterium]|nr:hypothetical protein [Bacteroidales bacterium]